MYVNASTIFFEHYTLNTKEAGNMISEVLRLLLPPQWLRSLVGLDPFASTVILWFACLFVLLVSCLVRDYRRVRWAMRELAQARLEAGITH